MKKINLILLMLISASLLLLAGEKLLPKHKDWLELVSPIITKTEKDVFLKLNTGQERDKFISLFWNRRDPMPDTREAFSGTGATPCRIPVKTNFIKNT